MSLGDYADVFCRVQGPLTLAEFNSRIEADFAILAGLSRGLSGGDILNICVNAIHAGSVNDDPANWRVTQEMMEKEIRKVRRAKTEHDGESGRARRFMMANYGGLMKRLFMATAVV